jgi:hypothetical protein
VGQVWQRKRERVRFLIRNLKIEIEIKQRGFQKNLLTPN